MHQVLLVEDSEECKLMVKMALQGSDIELTCASTEAEATSFLQKNSFDLAVVDIGLPDGNGISLVEKLKSSQSTKNLPVFLLTGNEALETKVEAFNLGVDDYLVKPVNPLELGARMKMRIKKNDGSKEKLRFGNLVLDLKMLRAKLVREGNEQTMDLTGKEFRILSVLASEEGRVFSRPELVAAVWGKTVHVLDRTVDSHICAIRRKLGEYSDYVESVAGSGYRFRTK